MTYKIYNSEFIQWAQDSVFLQESKFHAVLCDPPYGLEFMGKEWDRFDIRQPGNPTLPVSKAGPFRRAKVRHAASPGYGKAQEAKEGFEKEVQKWGVALLPLLYPGALVFMFGGTRMWHRLATGMEDAGFHLWDTMMWLYGTGFPKARDISKTTTEDWVGYKTPQLKPAWEPILCFKAPSEETYTDLAFKYGSGLLNVAAGRIFVDPIKDASQLRTMNRSQRTEDVSGQTWGMSKSGGDKPQVVRPEGRYPANLVLDEISAAQLDEQTGVLTSGKSKPEYRKKAGNNVYGKYKNDDISINVIGDSGGASRFFYVAKATQKERGAGIEGKNEHPTIKPIELNRWLASLLLPPPSVNPRRLLVPFSGVGSEMIGAVLAGWDEVIGVEMDTKFGYCEIAEARLKHWITK